MELLNESKQNPSYKAAKVGLLVAFTTSLCCITPVLALISGVTGVAATFSWMEPLRPFMITLTIGILGFSWYHKLRPRTAEEIACNCNTDEKSPFIQTSMFLGIVTVLGISLLSFPSYSHIFYPDITQNTTTGIEIANIQQLNFTIKGMTCSSCEEHINYTTSQVGGVLGVNASFEKGRVVIAYDQSKVTKEKIVEAINFTGYKVVE